MNFGVVPPDSNVTQHVFHTTAFSSAFRSIVAFFDRPSSDTVLFSGYPIDLSNPSFEDIDRAAARCGLSTELHKTPLHRLSSSVLPTLALFADGRALAILEQRSRNIFIVNGEDPAIPVEISRKQLKKLKPQTLMLFDVVYFNNDERAGIGGAKNYENKHWLGKSLAPFWKAYINVAIAAMFINLIALATPIFVMNVYDRILPNQAISSLWILAAGVTMVLLFDLLLKTARAAIIDHTGREADQKLAYTIYEKVLHSKLSHRAQSTGEFASRLGQYEFVREFFTSSTISVLIDSFFAFIFLGVILYLTGVIAIIPAVAFGLTVLLGLIAQYRIGKRVSRAANESAERNALLVESIATIETVKALRSEAHLLRKWAQLTKQSSKTAHDIKQISARAANTTQYIQQMVTIGIVIAGAYAFAAGDISTGAIIATVMLASRAVAPLGQIAMTLARLRQAVLSVRILNQIMSQPEDRPTSTGFVNREINSGQIDLVGVEFTYPSTEHPVLTDINLSVRSGERIGVVGKIGSGKTTFGKLLGGLFEPTGGHLSLDGIDVRQYHPYEVRKAVSFVGQSSDLFTGTLRENLLIAAPTASDDEVLAAATAAGVDEFARRHPRGYDMPVGERGERLSGGQKQAVTLARLLLQTPKVIFLDEPSGAMDMASERRLVANLTKAFKSETTLIISTHRFSLLEMVDRLIVMDNGRIIADGPKAKVLSDLQASAVAHRAKPDIQIKKPAAAMAGDR